MKVNVLKARVKLFSALFVSRDDAYIEWRNGTPVAVRERLSDEVVRDHLTGKRRIGTYFLKSGDCMTPKLAFDVDKKSRKLVNRIVKRLRDCGATPYVERSKSKGFHIWIFFNKAIPAWRARSFAQTILHGVDGSKVEIFPKQNRGTDLGFGLALPLFKPDVWKNRTAFLDSDFHPVPDQFAHLRSIRRTFRKKVRKAVRTARVGRVELTARPRMTESDSAGVLRKPGRNNELFKIAARMRDMGLGEAEILTTLKKVNEIRCKPLLEEKELVEIASNACRYGKSPKKGERKTDLVAIAKNVNLFRTSDDHCYGVIEMDGHRETWRLREKHFTNWLASSYYREFGTIPSAKDLGAAIDVLEGRARFDGPQRRVYIRVAEKAGAVYVDLCDKTWRAIKITSKGWRIIKNPLVRFRRAAGMHPLPVPVSGGSVDELRPFLNVRSEKDFKLLVGWLLSTLNPRGPYPVLLIQGEAGCAKSTTSRVLRRLVDPNKCPLRAEPREARDLMIAATNSRCVVFDNISNLRPWLSDNFCRLATGGGFAVRKNYSDDQEMLFESANPILLNGIDGVVSRGDLLDRCVVIYLPVIRDQNRKPEKEFWNDFEKAQGRIFGALLNAVSMALRRFDKVKMNEAPRMADFAKWVIAAEPALKWPPGSFLDSYRSNRKSANRMALDSSPILEHLRTLVIRHGFIGTASQLLLRLQNIAKDRAKDPYFPKYAKALSSHLRRIAPNLRADDFEIEFDIKTPGGNSRKLIKIAYHIS